MKHRLYTQLVYLLVICALVFGQPAAAGSSKLSTASGPGSLSQSVSIFDSPLPQPSPTPPIEQPTEPPTCATETADDAVLTVRFASVEARPGEEATLSWTLLNCRPLVLEGAQLTFTSPKGATLGERDAPAPLSDNPNTRAVSWALPPLQAGQALDGQFALRTPGLRVGDSITVSGEVKGADGAVIHQDSAELRIVPAAATATHIGAQGGRVELEDGRVRLEFPRGAAREDCLVQARPVGNPHGAPVNIGRGYEFAARGAQGQELRAFPIAPTLTIRYLPEETLPDALYLQDADGSWQRLATERDLRTLSISAELPYLSVVAEGADVMPSVLPSLRGAQHDLFSGAAIFTYDIPLPPGAGGLTPKLALQYNSVSQNNDPGYNSVLGAGWNLSVDSYVADGWFFGGTGSNPLPTIWRIDGVSFTEGGGESKYFVEAPDWRLQKDNKTASAYAPDGRRFDFRRAFCRRNSEKGLRCGV